jgi:hypothetical protein
MFNTIEKVCIYAAWEPIPVIVWKYVGFTTNISNKADSRQARLPV